MALYRKAAKQTLLDEEKRMVAILQELIESKGISFRASDVPVGDVESRDQELRLVPFQEAMTYYTGPDVEAISSTSPLLLQYVGSQPLLAATHIAFAFHLPLVLTPDAVWATLTRGFAIHLSMNSEQFRDHFVNFSGKEILSVRRDDFHPGDPDLPWPDIIAEFAEQIKERAPEAGTLLDARFSTTGLAEKTAFRVAMMDAMQHYFGYALETVCGIPEITLEGEPEDWQQIAARAEAFRSYDLDWWVDALEPITAAFVAASQGQVDSIFWDNIYKFHPPKGSGSYYTTGWIKDLFPYLQPLPYDRINRDFRLNDSLGTKTGPVINEFPAMPAKAPLTWRYLDQIHEMELIAGLMGVSYDPDSLYVKPEFGWAIRYRTPYTPSPMMSNF